MAEGQGVEDGERKVGVVSELKAFGAHSGSGDPQVEDDVVGVETETAVGGGEGVLGDAPVAVPSAHYGAFDGAAVGVYDGAVDAEIGVAHHVVVVGGQLGRSGLELAELSEESGYGLGCALHDDGPGLGGGEGVGS